MPKTVIIIIVYHRHKPMDWWKPVSSYFLNRESQITRVCQHVFACRIARPDLCNVGTRILKPYRCMHIVSLLLYRCPNCCDRIEVITSMALKNTLSLDVMQCRTVNIHENFGRTYCLHVQGRILRQAKRRHKVRESSLLCLEESKYCMYGRHKNLTSLAHSRKGPSTPSLPAVHVITRTAYLSQTE
jgi:hypothetical protein